MVKNKFFSKEYDDFFLYIYEAGYRCISSIGSESEIIRIHKDMSQPKTWTSTDSSFISRALDRYFGSGTWAYIGSDELDKDTKFFVITFPEGFTPETFKFKVLLDKMGAGPEDLD